MSQGEQEKPRRARRQPMVTAGSIPARERGEAVLAGRTRGSRTPEHPPGPPAPAGGEALSPPVERHRSEALFGTLPKATDNQLGEVAAAGFAIGPRRIVTETISGSVATARHRGSARLLDRLEAGDVLVVTRLDRLGRNATDVGSTVAKLADMGRLARTGENPR